MQRKAIVTWVLALCIGSAAAIAVAQGRAIPPQNSGSTGTKVSNQGQIKTPLDPEVRRKLEAANKRSLKALKEAQQLFKERRFGEAIKACNRSLELSPKIDGKPMETRAQRLIGDIYQEQNLYPQAIAAYRKSWHQPHDSTPDLDVALCYVKLGNIKQARKFYNEDKFFGTARSSRAEQASYMAMLPGTKTAKTMEASILFARGGIKSSTGSLDESVADYKRALRLVPRNALIATRCAQDLASDYRGEEATQYWARAAVFGTGEIKQEGLRRLKNVLMPDKVELALDEARKIKG